MNGFSAVFRKLIVHALKRKTNQDVATVPGRPGILTQLSVAIVIARSCRIVISHKKIMPNLFRISHEIHIPRDMSLKYMFLECYTCAYVLKLMWQECLLIRNAFIICVCVDKDQRVGTNYNVTCLVYPFTPQLINCYPLVHLAHMLFSFTSLL